MIPKIGAAINVTNAAGGKITGTTNTHNNTITADATKPGQGSIFTTHSNSARAAIPLPTSVDISFCVCCLWYSLSRASISALSLAFLSLYFLQLTHAPSSSSYWLQSACATMIVSILDWLYANICTEKASNRSKNSRFIKNLRKSNSIHKCNQKNTIVKNFSVFFDFSPKIHTFSNKKVLKKSGDRSKKDKASCTKSSFYNDSTI